MSQQLQLGGILFPAVDQADFTGPFEVLSRVSNSLKARKVTSRPFQILWQRCFGKLAVIAGALGCLSGLSQTTHDALDASLRDQKDQQFPQSAPYSSGAEIGRHLGYSVPMPDYNVQGEKFRVVVPSGYATNQDWGLLVWISPENQAQVPEALLSQLASRRLLLVSAYKSGNDRHPLDRFRLALDATCNMCRGYPVDRNRIYIGGFSGGSRIASMLGVAYGDLYSGTLCLCGVNFYRPVRGAEGEEYPATFDPDPSALARAKRLGRFALVTGETDPNRPGTRALTQSGFKREGFRNVLYLEVKGMGHAVPNTEKLIAALNFLDPARASQP